MARAAAVFVVEQRDEIRMSGEVVEGGFDQIADRQFRRQALEIELALLLADLLIDPFQHREVECVLVTEIVIDQLLVDTGARSDLVDPGAGKAACGEFAPGSGQQLASVASGLRRCTLVTLELVLSISTRQLTIAGSLVALVALRVLTGKGGCSEGSVP
jgi:hypothetical protein